MEDHVAGTQDLRGKRLEDKKREKNQREVEEPYTPAVTKGCLMEVGGASYPLTGWDESHHPVRT